MHTPSTNGRITVYVTLPPMLAKYRANAPSRPAFPVTLDRGSTLRDLVAGLKMPPGLPELFFINRRRCGPDGGCTLGTSAL